MSSRTLARPAASVALVTSAALVVATAVLAMLPAPARAGTSGSVALASDYPFRGVSQTNGGPALQAGIEHAADNGFYAGAWGSNVSWLSDLSAAGTPISNSLELDGSLGYRGTFGSAVGIDAGALVYHYPGDYPSGFNRPDTGEIYFGLSAGGGLGMGVFSAKYSYAFTDLFGYADSDGSGYLDLGAKWEFTPGWTLDAHGGRQWIRNNQSFAYRDWKLGVTRALANGFAIAAAYTGTDADDALYRNAHGNQIADGTITMTVSKGFQGHGVPGTRGSRDASNPSPTPGVPA